MTKKEYKAKIKELETQLKYYSSLLDYLSHNWDGNVCWEDIRDGQKIPPPLDTFYLFASWLINEVPEAENYLCLGWNLDGRGYQMEVSYRDKETSATKAERLQKRVAELEAQLEALNDPNRTT